jgi:hypothetical protein
MTIYSNLIAIDCHGTTSGASKAVSVDQLFPRDLLDNIKQAILPSADVDDWQTPLRLDNNLFTDGEVQPLIAAISNNFDPTFFP